MPSLALIVAVGAALGVALVVYGMLQAGRDAGVE